MVFRLAAVLLVLLPVAHLLVVRLAVLLRVVLVLRVRPALRWSPVFPPSRVRKDGPLR